LKHVVLPPVLVQSLKALRVRGLWLRTIWYSFPTPFPPVFSLLSNHLVSLGISFTQISAKSVQASFFRFVRGFPTFLPFDPFIPGPRVPPMGLGSGRLLLQPVAVTPFLYFWLMPLLASQARGLLPYSGCYPLGTAPSSFVDFSASLSACL